MRCVLQELKCIEMCFMENRFSFKTIDTFFLLKIAITFNN